MTSTGSMPGEGTPSMLGDMDVPPFWPPFLTFWGLNSIFWGYFFSSTNTKTIFWGIRITISYKIRSFWPQIQFFPRSLWVQFSADSGTPPSIFEPSILDETLESYVSAIGDIACNIYWPYLSNIICPESIYRQTSNVKRTKSQNLDVSRH